VRNFAIDREFLRLDSERCDVEVGISIDQSCFWIKGNIP